MPLEIVGAQICMYRHKLLFTTAHMHSRPTLPCDAMPQVSGKSLQDPVPWGGAGSLGHALLEPTLIYVKRLLALTDAVSVKASCPSFLYSTW